MDTTTRNSQAVTEDAISERKLWTAVVKMAVEDWRFGTLRAKREAQTFLFANDQDFGEVCVAAGLEPSSLRTQLLRIGKRIEMEGPYRNPIAA